MKEVWKDVVGFYGYQVSNIGNVRSITRKVNGHKSSYVKKGKLLKHSNNSGYAQVVIQQNGLKKTIKIHRLVAESFIANHEVKPTINHINGIKNDNRVENLEWATRSENTKHKFASGLDNNRGVNHPCHILNEKDIIAIRRHKSDIKTRLMLSKRYGISASHLYSIITRKSWVHI